MKKIIFTLILMFTLIITVNGVHGAVITKDTRILETKIIANEIVYGSQNKTLKQVISENQDPDIVYISIIPNETTVSVLTDDYNYNVKTIIFTYQGSYAVLSLYGNSTEFINEIYIYLPSIHLQNIILIPNESSYDNGYQQGLKDGEQDGYDNGYDVAKRIFGFEINGQWLTAVEYATQQVTTAIQNTIAEWGINVDGIQYNATQWGDIRYQHGLSANKDNTALGIMFNGLASLFGVGLAFVLQLGSIELMGISLNMILGIGLLLVGLIAILGLVFGGK